MKGNKKFIPLLMLAPLMMGNSPKPQPKAEAYDAIQVNATCVEDKGDTYTSYRYAYDITVKNIGNLYCRSDFYVDDLEGREYIYFACDQSERLFEDVYIKPGNTYSFRGDTNKGDYNLSDSRYRLYTFGLSNYLDEIQYSNYSVKQKDGGHYYVSCNISGKTTKEYCEIIDITYDGIDYSLCSKNYSYDKKGEICDIYIPTNKSIDVSKLVVHKISAFEWKSYGINIDFEGIGNFFKWAGLTLFVFIPLFYLIFGVIPVKIVFGSIKRHKRNRVHN